jgi:hypothetical protein
MPKIFLIIALLIGLPFFAIGVSESYKVIEMEKEYIATEGKVIGNDYHAFAESGAAYRPIVEFQTKTGEKIQFTDAIGSFPADYQENETVQVLYKSDRPDTAQIKSWKRLWLAPTIFLIVGALPFLVALVISRIINKKGNI